MGWKTFERPGFFGSKKQEKIDSYNQMFGDNNWRLVWSWLDDFVDFDIACQLYEDGYYNDSFKREKIWEELIKTASNVYDHEESNILSGFDYNFQEGNSTHLQDISIRRVVLRRGWKFQGDELIQIRSHSDYFGKNLSPGRVPFHMPEHIIEPHLKKWWDKDSIEDFYQSNKYLQILKRV